MREFLGVCSNFIRSGRSGLGLWKGGVMRREREAGPDLFSLRCQTCSKYLIRTESGYLACPMGHGRLQIDHLTTTPDVEAESFSMFQDDLEVMQ